jgi:acetyl-CoA decarbonylase/synthase complex subunit delta
MTFEPVKKTWPGRIREVTLGGGLTVGGETALPLHRFDGEIPHRPVIALEVTDREPRDWPDAVRAPFESVLKDPAAWARAAVEEHGADLVCLHLRTAHPDRGDRPADECAELARAVASAVAAPLILQGPGPSDKQDEVLRRCAEATEGRNCLLASAVEGHYRTLVAAAQAYGHSLVAESPIDVNLAKQLNILITEMSFPPERIVIDPLTGGLGYGLEYTYSVMERIRIQGLSGDTFLAMPFVCFVGAEVWKVKEARMPEADAPSWGDAVHRGILWEVSTAMALSAAGADILVLRHPESAALVRGALGDLVGGS